MSDIERGHLDATTLGRSRAIAAALGARLDIAVRWRGGELDRLLNARHSAMHEQVARQLARLPGWSFAQEVSFSIYGERGVIDLIAWHEARRALLVIELKTELVDVNDLLATMDRRRRLAREIGRQRGWDAVTVSAWVVLADSHTNRRRLAAHMTTLRHAFPLDGRSIRPWLRTAASSVTALSFLPIAAGDGRRQAPTGRQRVRRPRPRLPEHDQRPGRPAEPRVGVAFRR